MNLGLSGYLYVFLALLFVLALIALAATLARRFGFGFPGAPKGGRGRRLRIAEVLTLSPKHRLVLVSRDETEHLLLLGANTDVVVERDIGKARFAAALEDATRDETP